LVQKSLLSSVRNSRAFPSADCGSDHQLVVANIKFKLKKSPPAKHNRKIDINKLTDPETQANNHETAEAKWKQLLKEEPSNANEEWNKVKSVIHETSADQLGYGTGQKPKKWISDDTCHLIDEKRKYKALCKVQPEAAKHHNFLCTAVKRVNVKARRNLANKR